MLSCLSCVGVAEETGACCDWRLSLSLYIWGWWRWWRWWGCECAVEELRKERPPDASVPPYIIKHQHSKDLCVRRVLTTNWRENTFDKYLQLKYVLKSILKKILLKMIWCVKQNFHSFHYISSKCFRQIRDGCAEIVLKTSWFDLKSILSEN